MFKTKSDQRGIAHLGLIVAVLVVVAGTGVAIWRVSSNNSNKGSSGSNSSSSSLGKVTTDKQVQDACNSAVHDSTLCKFAASYNANAAYKATATTTGGDNNGSLTIGSDGKGNYSLSGTSAGQSLDTITIGSTSYIKDETTGTWLKYGSDSSAATNPASSFKLSTSDITGNGAITYKNLGTEACGNLTCYKYQQLDKNNASDTTYFWFDNKDYQLRRFSLTDPSTGTTDMTFSYENVSITAPSPVQDATQ